eukprot:CAMPEP_0114349158 /NCGR_PEP_ID=MMETSP0101-20121206/15315_1 /TAXON_ID=38822 ORGANISM="Pteridomonas danica, Strain PT" /NCGR_SAMPLE_ID=MMETSP0101 /ASSEMBLY_ACC=CAM_ASM_000211 /LENGTH=71 /DNA_ID=CAMNT_0001487577 /DNA_START=371 /DNA_END=586 /DNA_ORIENTATION=+
MKDDNQKHCHNNHDENENENDENVLSKHFLKVSNRVRELRNYLKNLLLEKTIGDSVSEAIAASELLSQIDV